MKNNFLILYIQGINPQDLRGSLTGVYIGHQTMAAPGDMPEELQLDSAKSHFNRGLWIGGTGKNMYANRISFCFDFKGPSFVMDTAWFIKFIGFRYCGN